MLGFLDELSNITGLPFDEAYKDYKIVNLGGKALYVQNYVKLLSYQKNAITLKIKNNEITIGGANLRIKELGNNNIVIDGNINVCYLKKEFDAYENDKKETDSKPNKKTK